MLALRFRSFCRDAGLSIDEAAKILHVTPRTIRYWFSGQTAVPYAAYKLLRVMRWFELPQPGFEGWCMHSGKLWTPEGVGIEPVDGAWWSLLVRQARSFRTLYAERSALNRVLHVIGALEPNRGAPLAGGSGSAEVTAEVLTSESSPLVITGITAGVTPVTEVDHG
jgi:transcriptional regulator with XRE-family HTH domain